MTTKESIPFRKGDWHCPKCQNHNFASRRECRGCSTKRPGGSAAPAVTRKPGDWTCATCLTMNFKWRTHCFKCDKKRGAEGGAGAESDPPLDTGSTTRKQKRTAKERLEELATKAALAAVQALAAEIDDDDDDGEKGKEKANAGRADEENRIECKVCMDKPKNTMLTLCGHYDLCELCAAILTQCPICKRNYDPSKDTVRVFES